MNRISFRAVVIAAFAQYGLDLVIGTTLLAILGRATLTADLTQDELRAATQAVIDSGQFLFGIVVFGTATTVAGGYIAARLAKDFPYYNGLAIGIVGILYGLLFLQQNPIWLSVLAFVTTVPASIYGAHLARKHMEALRAAPGRG